MKAERWFLKTLDNEILDGPFKSSLEAEGERRQYAKDYKYEPILDSEVIDVLDPLEIGDRFFS